MSPEHKEIYDCGTYARCSGFPKSDCPTYPSKYERALWVAGWSRELTNKTAQNLVIRKTLLSSVREELLPLIQE